LVIIGDPEPHKLLKCTFSITNYSSSDCSIYKGVNFAIFFNQRNLSVRLRSKLIDYISFLCRSREIKTYFAAPLTLGWEWALGPRSSAYGCISICCLVSEPRTLPRNTTPNRTRLLHLFVYLAGIVFQFQGSASVCLFSCALTPDCLLWFAGVVPAATATAEWITKQAVANCNLIRKKFATQSA